mmetsp:Transcript_1290/g.1585  ORF Transcript_1290/g.1585 Transcript_1290/m.1585 type:complete len:205 (-) Transcript_1290:2379-2993(-)
MIEKSLFYVRNEFKRYVTEEVFTKFEQHESKFVAVEDEIKVSSKLLEGKLELHQSSFREYKEKIANEFKSVNFQIDSINEQITNEQSDLHKLKVRVKTTLKVELEKLESLNEEIEYEFKRINSYIDINQTLMQVLLEDSMINQMLIEQDMVDRKSIAMFGLKKNSEVLGTNQGAMGNHYKRSSSTSSADKALTNLGLWDLRNKG